MTSSLESVTCPQCGAPSVHMTTSTGTAVLVCPSCELVVKGEKVERARELFKARRKLVKALWSLRDDFENSKFEVLEFKRQRDNVALHLGWIDTELEEEVVVG